MRKEKNKSKEERTQVKEAGTPGWAGGWKEKDTDEAPCISTSEQATDVAEERRQLKSINQNHNWRTCVQKRSMQICLKGDEPVTSSKVENPGRKKFRTGTGTTLPITYEWQRGWYVC